MTTTISTLRTGIKAAIAGISALSGVEVFDAALPAHAYAVALRKPGIVLCYAGKSKVAPSELAARDNYRIVYRWTLTAVVDEWRTAAGALTTTLGIEEIAEALDGLRTVQIGTVNSQDTWMVWLSERVDAPADRGAEGGPAALVTEWQTTEVLV